MISRRASRPPVRGPSSTARRVRIAARMVDLRRPGWHAVRARPSLPFAAVLVLLPPSEGKRAPDAGAPVDLPPLTSRALPGRREKALRALVKRATGNRRRAVEHLGLSAGQAAEVDRDAALATAPAAPAG